VCVIVYFQKHALVNFSPKYFISLHLLTFTSLIHFSV
jgi:hypothetical protein